MFRLLDRAAFGLVFEAFIDDLGAGGGGVLAIDGRTFRRSFDRAAGRSALHVVTVFGTGARFAIARHAIGLGRERDPHRPRPARNLALEGLLVAGDAIHARADTAQVVLEPGSNQQFARRRPTARRC